MIPEFKEFPKMARLSRDIIITEKIDGTNASVYIPDDESYVLAGSRTRWLGITKETDNYGFGRWVFDNQEELKKLGPGTHFGEWWGKGIQSGYNQTRKIFSLFNTYRWSNDDTRPKCCQVVPVLYTGPLDLHIVDIALHQLKEYGSVAAPGFMNPEGVIVWHTAANIGFKKTIKHDEIPKSLIPKEELNAL